MSEKSESNVKDQVRQFYDKVGWKMVSDGVYQNARYEDLRPVSHDYISKCHLRVNRHLKNTGKYLLDAGSGPIQYPEYLTYSENYDYRVCLDISIVALKDARKRIGDKGLFVVADVANMPFAESVFDGLVSLHTLHHLPIKQQKQSFIGFSRVLKPCASGVVVNGWTDSELMRKTWWLVKFMENTGQLILNRKKASKPETTPQNQKTNARRIIEETPSEPQGTFIEKMDSDWIRMTLSKMMRFDIFVWRSVNVRFLRAVIHKALAGKLVLKLLYALEEKYPRYFGEKGQYPLIVIYK